MTGPEHYRKAEVLLKTAVKNFRLDRDTSAALAAAQAHATLALAAATALPPGDPDSASRGAWVSVIHELEDGR